MKILVVGASGYLGYAVCQVLDAAGHEVLALSRSGRAHFGTGVVGNVLSPSMGLGDDAEWVFDGVEVVVSCFGSVEMDTTSVIDTHVTGTRNVLDLAARIDSVTRVVYVSSVVALGRAKGAITNRDLARGQSFRNFYEYAKYRGELIARRESRVPVSILRIGPLLGAAPADVIPLQGGPIAALPHLLAGLPVVLEARGDFPIYACDVALAAEVVRDLATAQKPPTATTYFDPKLPTLAAILEQLCRPWGVLPKIVDGVGPRWIQRAAAKRFGVEPAIVDYVRPLFTFDDSVRERMPIPDTHADPDYVVATGRALRESGLALTGIGGQR